MPAGGGVAAGGTQALGLAVGQVLMAGDRQGRSGADVQVVVLQGVAPVVVMLTGRGDFDAWTQGQARGPRTVQVASGLLVLVSCEKLSVVFTVRRTAGLVSVRGGVLQGERLLLSWAEDFLGCEVGVICGGGN